MDENHRLDFADIIASTIHDTKNTIGMIFNSLEEMTARCRQQGCEHHQDLFLFQYEIKRLNNSLIRLLALYKAQKAPLRININLHSLRDCLEELIDQNEPVLISRQIQWEMDCPDDLFWSFDKGLIVGVLDNVLNNTYRYTKNLLKISAQQEGGWLVLTVEDNGPGYPPGFIMDSGIPGGMTKPVSFLTGNTGLGLYFSVLVAAAHRRNNLQGHIRVANGGSLGGGVFSLHLP